MASDTWFGWTCGALQRREHWDQRTQDATPLRYAGLAGYAPTATFTLAEETARLGRERGATVHVGAVVTSGVFYDPDSTTFARWKRLGHLGVEMEAAMLYTIAAVKRVEALAVMTVSDLLAESGDTERISDAALKRGVDDMMRLACSGGGQLTRRSRSSNGVRSNRDR